MASNVKYFVLARFSQAYALKYKRPWRETPMQKRVPNSVPAGFSQAYTLKYKRPWRETPMHIRALNYRKPNLKLKTRF
jgi:hypothetical protein